LEITRQFDQRTEQEYKHASELLNTILAADDIQQATASHIQEINDAFVQVLNQALQEANQKNDAERMPKLQQIVAVLQQASTPPPELALLEELLDASDEAALNKMLEQHAEEITPELSSVIGNILARSEEQAGRKPHAEDAQTIEKLRALYKAVLKFSMRKSLL
jgi:Zn-dependent M32 family carboxypeptidase